MTEMAAHLDKIATDAVDSAACFVAVAASRVCGSGEASMGSSAQMSLSRPVRDQLMHNP